jgi:flavodoxin
MNVLVLFDSEFGNTERVARAVAGVLEKSFPVRIAKADSKTTAGAGGADLLIVGGPTHRRRMSRRLAASFESLPRKSLRGVRTAAFDTRYRMPAWLSGSAAGGIARRLRKLGGQALRPPVSFFVARDVPPEGGKRRHDLESLEAGELERAETWAAEIGKAIAG